MTSTVRKADIFDLPRYAELASEFITASPISSIVKPDIATITDFLLGAIEQDHIGVWLAEKEGKIVGICGAMAYPLYFSPSHTMAQELWWWLTPAARGGDTGKQMFDTIEAWAKERGAAAVFMLSLANQRPQVMERVYTKAGYTPMEHTFVKGLDTWQ